MYYFIKDDKIKRKGIKFIIKRRKNGTFAKGKWSRARRKKRA